MAFDVASTIRQTADQYGVDPDFALKVARAESNLNPAAVSPKGAQGVMQLTPPTAQDMGVDIHDVRQNIVGGVKRLRQLQDRYNGDHQLMAAAYNAGPGAVDKHGGVPPFPETQAYVHKVTGQDPALPSPDQVLKSIGYTAPAKPEAAPTQAPGPGDALPSPDQVLKGMGWKAPAAPAAPAVSAAQAKANADAQAYMAGKDASGKSILGPGDAPANEAMAGYNVLNGMTLNGAPIMHGAVRALETGAQNALSRIGIGHAQQFGMGEAFSANRDAMQASLDEYQKAHPYGSAAQNLVGFASSGPAGALEKGVGAVAAKVAPNLTTKLAGRVALGAAKAGAVGAAAGGASAASQGGDVGDVAKGAAFGAVTAAPLGAAGSAVSALPLRPGVVRSVAAPALGAAAGGALGYAQGGKVGAGEGAILGASVGMHAGKGAKANAEVTPKDRATALDLLAKAHPEAQEALANAEPHATAAEALGPQGQALVQSAAKGGESAVAPIAEALQQRAQPQARMERLTQSVQDATGIDPASAHEDITAQVDAARRGPAKAAYDAALTGKPVWTPELAQLAKEPEVRTALDKARRVLGSEAFSDNPNALVTDEGRPIISSADYQRYLKTGDETLLTPNAQPQQAPTDKAWDLAKQLLDKSVARNAFGKVESSTDNHLAMHWSGAVRDALDQAIPGYQEARSVAGDYLSSRQAYENGQSLWNGSRPDNNAAGFDKRFGGLTPAEQQATRMGYLSEFYRKLENGKLDPKQLVESPFHQKVMQTMFGDERAAQIAAAAKREQALAASAKATMSSAKTSAKTDDAHNALGPTAGAAVGFLEGGSLHSTLRGALGGAAMRGASDIGRAMKSGQVTPQVRTALGDILAGDPKAVAEELRTTKRPKEVRLSDLPAFKAVGPGLGRAVAAEAGTKAQSAFAGIEGRD